MLSGRRSTCKYKGSGNFVKINMSIYAEEINEGLVITKPNLGFPINVKSPRINFFGGKIQ